MILRNCQISREPILLSQTNLPVLTLYVNLQKGIVHLCLTEEKEFYSPEYCQTLRLEHLWDYENLFETGVVRASED